MPRTTSLVAAFALLSFAMSPAADADAEYSLNAGESVTHQGEAVPGGANPLYFDQNGVAGGDESCSKDVTTYCETVLVALTNPVADTDPDVLEFAQRTLSVTLSTQAADYDLIVYSSDAQGTKGAEIGRSTAFPTSGFGESVQGSILTTDENPTAYAVIHVVYFAPTTPMSLDIRF